MKMKSFIHRMKHNIVRLFAVISAFYIATAAASINQIKVDEQKPLNVTHHIQTHPIDKHKESELIAGSWQQEVLRELMAARTLPLDENEALRIHNESGASLRHHEMTNLSHGIASHAMQQGLEQLQHHLLRENFEQRAQALVTLDALILMQEATLDRVQKQLNAMSAPPAIQARQQQFEQQWRQTELRLRELKQWLSSQSRQNDSKALNLLETLNHKATHQSWYRSSLPYNHLTPAPRALPERTDIAPSYQQTEPGLPTSADYADSSRLPHPSILALAEELEYDYIQIYDFVRTNIHTQWYQGGMKSAAQVLKTRAGNSLDQSRLLVALLRASGAAARHVYGVVSLTPEQVGSSLGLFQADKIASALSRAGIAHRAVINAGRISHFEIEHHWVSSYLPYGNYRGAGIDLSAYHWLPLDPSIKQHHYQASSDLINNAPVDIAQIFDGYFTSTQNTDPLTALLQAYRDHITDLDLDAANEIATVDSLVAQQAPGEPPIGLLPSSLPYPVVSVFSETAELAAEHEQQLEIRIYSPNDSTNNNLDTLLRKQHFFVSELNEQRLTLSYAPASVDDFNIINNFGGLDNTPAYLVRLRPQINLNGQELIVDNNAEQGNQATLNASALSLGQQHRLELILHTPWGQQTIEQELTVGSYLALAISPPGTFHTNHEIALNLDESTALPDDKEQQAAQLLYSQALRYSQQWEHGQQQLSELWDFALIQALPSITMALSQVEITTQNGLAFDLDFQGVVLDAAFRSIAPLPRSANTEIGVQDWLNWSALQGSYLEQAIFKQQWLVESISADTGIALANNQGIPLLSVDQDSNPSVWQSLSHHPNVIEAISTQIANGLTILIPQREIQFNQWRGSTWLARDHQRGNQGYFISGQYAGGATTETPADWLLDFLAIALASPYSATPNTDALSAAFLDKIAPTDFQRGKVDEALERPLAVLVRDIRGRPVSGAEVRFTALEGGTFGNNGNSINVQTDDNGVAQAFFRLGTQTTERRGRYLLLNDNDRFPTLHGEYPVDASVSSRLGEISLSQTFTSYAAPGAAEQLLSNGDNRQEIFGPNLFAGNLNYRVEDRFGNPIANHQVQFFSPESPSLCTNISEPTSHAVFTSPQECQSQFPLGHQCGENPYTILSNSDGSVESWAILGRLGGTDHHIEISAANQSQTLIWKDSFRQLFDEGVLNLPGSCAYGPFIEPVVREFVARDRFGKSIEGAAAFESSKIPRLLAINTCYQDRIEDSTAEASIAHCQLTTANVNINAEPGQTEAISFLPDLKFYAASIQVANAPSIIEPTVLLNDVQVIGDFGGQIVEDTWVPTISKALAPVYAVDSRISTIEPQQINLNEAGLTTHEIIVNFEVLPLEFGAETLVILENSEGQALDAVLWQSPNNQGSVSFPRGLPLELDQSYQIRLLINPGAGEIQGASAELGLSQNIVLNVCAQGSLDFTTNQPLCSRVINRRVPTPLFLSSDLDIANQRSCDINEFSLTLSQDAVVNVRFERMNADGSGSGIINDLLTNLNLSRGSHTLEVNPFELGSGEHRLIIDSTSQIDGREEQVTGSLQVLVQYTDVLPVGHPNIKGVDLFSGDISIARQDLHIPGRGPQLAFSRSYNSANASIPGVMGAGWTHNYLSRLVQNSCGDLIIIGAEGSGQRFTPTSDGFQAAPGYHGSLEALDEGFAFFSKNGTRYAYTRANNRSWWLEQISDPNGNAIDISYAPQAEFPQPISASSGDGRSLIFTYDSLQFENWSGEVLSQVSGTGGMQIDFEYDARGNLMRAFREGDIQHERYDYSSNTSPGQRHLITGFVNEINGAQRSYRYENSPAHIDTLPPNTELIKTQVSGLSESQGGSTNFSYSGIMGLEPVTTTVQPAVGDATQYLMDRYGVPEQIQDPIGISNLQWDNDHQLRQRTDANNVVQEFDYDEFGNLSLERTTNNGESLERRFTYIDPSAFSQPIKTRIASTVDWRGIETQFSYDTRGNPLSETRGGISTTQGFNGQGDRISLSDGRGNTTRFLYDERGNVIQMTDAGQNIISQEWDERSRLISSTDANQNTTRYSYDALDRLITTTLPTVDNAPSILRNNYNDATNQRVEIDPEGNQTEYQYDLMGREVQIVNARGDRFITEYDDLGNKTRQIDWRGNITTYSYDNANRLIILNEPEGRVTYFERDEVGNIIQTRVGNGDDARITRYEYKDPFYRNTAVERLFESGVARISNRYDGNGNLIQQTDAEGNDFRFVYDTRDRLTQRIEPLGRVTEFEYDNSDNRIVETRINSTGMQSTRTQFDAINRPTLITNATGDISLIAYDGNGNITEMVDGNRNITQLTYDSRNRLVQQQGPRDGFAVNFNYDGNNNRTSENYPNGRTINHTYDALNRLIGSSDALGTLQVVSYDANGNLQSQTNGRNFTRNWEYDALNRLVVERAPENRQHQFSYNIHHEVIQTVDARQQTTRLNYNQLGQLSSQTLPDQSTRQYLYDRRDNLTQFTDGRGNSTRFEYDALNQLRFVFDPNALGYQQEFRYDTQGNLTHQFDRRGTLTLRSYDAQNRLSTETRAGIPLRHVEYDANGNVSRVIDGEDNAIAYRYNGANELLQETRPLGAVTILERDALGNVLRESQPGGRIITRSYDIRQRLESETNHAGETTSYTYDANDNLTGLQRPELTLWNYAYDEADRLIEIINPENNQWRFGYDANDNRTAHTDPNQHSTQLDYDPLNRLRQRTYPDGLSERWEYDLNGNIQRFIDAEGQTDNYRYDEINRLTQISYGRGQSSSDITQVDYDYDANGNVLLISELELGQTQHHTIRRYDALDRLTFEEDRHGQALQFAYDNNGNRTQLIDAQQAVTLYEYDALNRLTQINAPLSGATQYQYFPNGQLRSVAWPNRVQSQYTYDAAARVESIQHQLAGNAFTAIEYAYDQNGNRSQETLTQGSETRITHYQYDQADRLNHITYPDRVVSYDLDGAANRLSERIVDQNQALIAEKRYRYNIRDQLERIDDAISGESTSYGYNAIGQQIHKTDAQGTTQYQYNSRRRLSTITLPDQQLIQHKYNDQGLRVSTEFNGTRKHYRYDGQSLIQETNVQGNLIARYTWSDQGLISESRNGLQTYLHTDALATPIAITDTSAAVVDRYRYDAWGRLEQHQGTSQQPFGFTGYQNDNNTGLYYAQQRYYNSETGRFLSHDPFAGDINTPISLHRYLYANASPAVFVDPTGEQACLGQALLNCPLDQFVPNNRAIPQNISSNAIQGLPETFAVFEDRIPAGIISLPPNQQIFTENYRLVPEVNPDEPEAALFYTAFRLDTNAPEFAIPPSQLDTFIAHSEKFLNIAALNDTLGGNSPSHIRSQRLFNAVLNQAGRVQDNRSINEELTQANSELLRDPVALFDLATGFVGAGPSRAFIRNTLKNRGKKAPKKRPVRSTLSDEDLQAEFVTFGIQENPLRFPSGERLLTRLRNADSNASNAEILRRANDQIKSGNELPRLAQVQPNERLIKLTPTGETPSSFTPFFVTEVEFRRLTKNNANLADQLGLPNNSSVELFDVFAIQPKEGQAPTVFKSTVAPIRQGSVTRPGGAEQTLVSERFRFTDPELIGQIEERL